MAAKKQWHFEEEETSTGIMFSVYNQDGTRITEPYITEESAKLIAAAPELLAFAEAYRIDLQERGVRESDMDAIAMDLLAMADRAIAKIA